MLLVGRVRTQIANLAALRNGRADNVVQPTESSASNKTVRDDDSMADAWIRQHERVREAIARAKAGAVPTKDAELDDEWVGPWVRQQQRVRDAIAQAKRRSSAARH